MSRILISVSSTWAAQKMVEPIADLAQRMDAEVLAVHVSHPSNSQAQDETERDGEEAIALLADKLKPRGVTVQTLLLFSDDIAQAILNTAEEREVTMIALGLTGKNIFARLLAGNVPVELIKNTKIPVMLIPPDWSGVL